MRRIISIWIIVSFIASSMVAPQRGYAQEQLNLPSPGTMVNLSPAFVPVLIRGLKVHPENPLLFDFILDTGRSGFQVNSPEFKVESEKLIKYFLASLTIKEDDLWVNLSPYEKDRTVPEELGQTELGRDMLAQDYILKQLTASLIYPERRLGKEFWSRVYSKAQQMFGSANIPVNTFNKVWIVADKAKVLERNNTAYVVGAHLKVMLEEDYLSLEKHGFMANPKGGPSNNSHTITSQIIRAIIIPELEKEVNQGQNFAVLRQIFYSMILATWYRSALKDALLNQVYSNKAKIQGILSGDPNVKEKIYEQYIKAYKKGVFNYIKEEPMFPPPGGEGQGGGTIPRKYFSGGLRVNVRRVLDVEETVTENDNTSPDGAMAIVETNMSRAQMGNAAMVPIDAGKQQQIVDYLMSSKEHDIEELARFGETLGLSRSEFWEVIRELSEQRAFKPDPLNQPKKFTSFLETYHEDGTPTGKIKDYWAIKKDKDWHMIADTFIFNSSGKLFLQVRKDGTLDSSAGGTTDIGLDEAGTAIKEAKEELNLDIRLSDLVPVRNNKRANGIFYSDFDDHQEDHFDEKGVFYAQAYQNTGREAKRSFTIVLNPAQELAWRRQVGGSIISWEQYLTGTRAVLNDEVSAIVEVDPKVLLQYYLSHPDPKERSKILAQGLNSELAHESIQQMLSGNPAMTSKQITFRNRREKDRQFEAVRQMRRYSNRINGRYGRSRGDINGVKYRQNNAAMMTYKSWQEVPAIPIFNYTRPNGQEVTITIGNNQIKQPHIEHYPSMHDLQIRRPGLKINSPFTEVISKRNAGVDLVLRWGSHHINVADLKDAKAFQQGTNGTVEQIELLDQESLFMDHLHGFLTDPRGLAARDVWYQQHPVSEVDIIWEAQNNRTDVVVGRPMRLPATNHQIVASINRLPSAMSVWGMGVDISQPLPTGNSAMTVVVQGKVSYGAQPIIGGGLFKIKGQDLFASEVRKIEVLEKGRWRIRYNNPRSDFNAAHHELIILAELHEQARITLEKIEQTTLPLSESPDRELDLVQRGEQSANTSSQKLTKALEEFYKKIEINIPGYVPQRPFNKAIRDNILEIIMKNNDEVPVWVKLDQNSWEQFLTAKIFEEFIEFQQTIAEEGHAAKGATLIEEASDILEIIDGMNNQQKWFVGDFGSYLRHAAQGIRNEPVTEQQLVEQITGDIIAISKADNSSRKEKVESLIIKLIQFARVNQVDFEAILSAKDKKKGKIGGFERRLFYVGKFYDQAGLEAFQNIGQAVAGNPFARKVSVAFNGGGTKEIEVFTGRMKPGDFTADATFDMNEYLRSFPRGRIERMLPNMLGSNRDRFFEILSGESREKAIAKIIDMIREQSTKSPVMLASGNVGTQEITLSRQQMAITTDGQANFVNLLDLLFKAHPGVTRDFVAKDIFEKANIVETILNDFAMGAQRDLAKTVLPPGGIDLNAKHMNLDVAKDGKGIEMKFDPAMVAEFKRGNFSGIVATIIRITPIASPLPLLGMDPLSEKPLAKA